MQSLPDLSQLSHPHKDALIHALWAMVVKLEGRGKELEDGLALNSSNSSKPPSSDGLSKPAPKSLRQSGQRPTGGQRGHSGRALRHSAQPDQVLSHHSAPLCTHCSAPLVPHEVIDKRQVFELPLLRVQVTEHQLICSTCTCGAAYVGEHPQGVNAPTQYGPRARAFATYLHQYHLLPLQRTSTAAQIPRRRMAHHEREGRALHEQLG